MRRDGRLRRWRSLGIVRGSPSHPGNVRRSVLDRFGRDADQRESAGLVEIPTRPREQAEIQRLRLGQLNLLTHESIARLLIALDGDLGNQRG